jgi:hypothetical protein
MTTTGCGLRGSTTSSSAHLLVVGLVLGEYLLSHFLLSLVDVGVELVSVLTDRELLIVINRDEDLFQAVWLLIWVVELSNVRVLKSLLSSESLAWVELEKVLQEIDGIVRGSWEHVSELLGLGGGQTLEHGLGKWTINRFDIFNAWSSGNLHNSIKLVKS